jgi:hypothetical protein
MPLLEKHPENIGWYWLSMNPAAMPLLEKHPEKISWYWLSMNPAAMPLLEKHPEKIDWVWLSRNPAIVDIDRRGYRTMLDEFIQCHRLDRGMVGHAN